LDSDSLVDRIHFSFVIFFCYTFFILENDGALLNLEPRLRASLFILLSTFCCKLQLMHLIDFNTSSQTKGYIGMRI